MMCSSGITSEKAVKLCVDTSYNDGIKRSRRASYLSAKALLSFNPVLSDSALLLLKSTRSVTSSVQAPRGMNAVVGGRCMVPTHGNAARARDEINEISRDEKIILLRRLYHSGHRTSKRRRTLETATETDEVPVQNIEKIHKSSRAGDWQLHQKIGDHDDNLMDLRVANNTKKESMIATASSTSIRKRPRESSDSSGSGKSLARIYASRSA